MARTYFVKKARKAQGLCRVCRDEQRPINAGDPYKWTKPRYMGKIVAHVDCKIPLSMVSSSKLVSIWEAQESFDTSDIESIPESLREFAGTVCEVSEEYQESADNQREYFPDSEVADENEEKAQELESWADEIESAADEADSSLSEYQELLDEKAELEEEQEGEITDDRKDEIESRLSELETEIADKETEISDHAEIINECPV